MQYLKQSTASQSVLIGPFVDSTDGVTAETGLTIANTDIRLSANGGNLAAKNSGGGTHDENGWYQITLDATDTATVGRLQLHVNKTGALPVFAEFQVLEEAVYDALFASGATGLLPANVTQISGDSTAADNLEAMYDGTGYINAVAPATQEQLDDVGVASGALAFEVDSDNSGGAIESVMFVGTQTGTFANVESENGIYHQIDHSGNAIDVVYEFAIGANRTASEALFRGYLDGSNDVINIQAYDFVGSDWETIRILSGQGGTGNVARNLALLSKHTGTGADDGRVLIRFVTSSQTSPILYVDQLLVEAVTNPVTATDLPTNFGDLSITVTDGKVTVGTNDDKTGYGLSDGAITAAKIAADAITAAKIATDAIGASQLSSGAVAKIEAALLNEGDGQALIDAIVQAIDAADIDTNLISTLTRDAILNRVLSGNHDTAGTVGKILQDIFGDTDELQTNQGNWLTATGFSTHSAADVWTAVTRPLTANTNLNDPTAAAIADAVLDEILSGHATAGSLGKAIADILEDSNELQGDWANDGRLDLLVDAIKASTDTITSIYHADIDLTIDTANSQDEYTCVWYKDGVPITSGITTPQIQVVKRADGTDLVAQTSMTEIGSTETFKYDEATNRITNGEAVLVIVTATIDASTRTWKRILGRDASS